MSRRISIFIVIVFSLAVVISAQAQYTTNPLEQAPAPAKPANQGPPPKPPDMVCFGEGPKWSIQFVSWGARYLGINQPDQDYIGGFTWVPDQKVWVWQRQNGLAPMGGGYGLSATITKASPAMGVTAITPAVQGTDQKTAISQLLLHGFVPEIHHVQCTACGRPGQVVKQQPGPGRRLFRWSQVRVDVLG